MNIDNKKKYILVLGKGPTFLEQEATTITKEAAYSINFSKSQRKFCLSLHYKGIKGF